MKSLKGILLALFTVVFYGAGMLSVLAYFGQWHYLLELTTHFRLQYVGLLAMAGLALVLVASRQWIIPWVLLLALAVAPVLPYYFPAATPVSTNAAYRLMTANVLKSNRSYAWMGQAIQTYQPDIIALQEPDQAWFNGLRPYVQKYPYQKLIPLDNNFGIALYSKLPASDIRVQYFGDDLFGTRFPSILAKLKWGQRDFLMLVTHPLPPMSGGFAVRNSQLADMARHRPQWAKNLIVAGDLNMAPWSPYFQKLLKDSGLRDTQMGFGIQPSWRVDCPLLAIPIDHVLVSPNFQVINRQVGPDTGSDHRPVIVDLFLKQG